MQSNFLYSLPSQSRKRRCSWEGAVGWEGRGGAPGVTVAGQLSANCHGDGDDRCVLAPCLCLCLVLVVVRRELHCRSSESCRCRSSPSLSLSLSSRTSDTILSPRALDFRRAQVSTTKVPTLVLARLTRRESSLPLPSPIPPNSFPLNHKVNKEPANKKGRENKGVRRR